MKRIKEKIIKYLIRRWCCFYCTACGNIRLIEQDEELALNPNCEKCKKCRFIVYPATLGELKKIIGFSYEP